jgi:sulfatase maturation enzyme AslB (radical SAM superfamily)
MRKFLRLKFPTELEFEPLQVCNAKCFCCPYTQLSEDPEYIKQRMTREQIAHLLTDFGEGLRRHNYKGETQVNPFRYSDPLICKDLDLVLELGQQYGYQVQITTNAKGFNPRNIELLKRHHNTLKPLSVSILGSTQEEVSDNMAIDLAYTMKKLQAISLVPEIRDKLYVSLRVIKDTKEEMDNLIALQEKLSKMSLKSQIKRNWMQNRIGSVGQISAEQGNYIVGCGLYRHKLLRRLEVMVNGDVVLCDDDAVGKKKFGNVFKQSIDEVWNGPVKDYHHAIFSPSYSEQKQSLICNDCSRASWQSPRYSTLENLKFIGIKESTKHLLKRNFSWV